MARELSFSVGIGSSPVSEFEDPQIANEFFRLYQAVNILATQLDSSTGALAASSSERPYILASTVSLEANVTRFYAEATVGLTMGELVAINTAGKVVKAQANTTHDLKARAVVLTNCFAGAYASLAYRGVVRAYVGLVPGRDYYLSSTAGGIAAIAPASSNTLQYIGFAVSGTELCFSPELRHSVA